MREDCVKSQRMHLENIFHSYFFLCLKKEGKKKERIGSKLKEN
jgi:hypothetical protein